MDEIPVTEDYFGYLGTHHLGEPGKIIFSLGTISPVPEYGEVVKDIEARGNDDGYFYPPLSYSARKPFGGGDLVKIPRSERPAAMYNAPATHMIACPGENVAEHRRGVLGFLIHLLGFLSGHQTQFYNWWVTGRIPVKSQEPFVINPREYQTLVATAESTWQRLPSEKQKHLTTILYCWGRLFAYEWLWEEFTFRYMLVDSIWRFHHDVDGPTRHRERLRVLCQELNLQFDVPAAKSIIDLRNDLFHESIWAGDTPGFEGSGVQQFTASVNLRNLVNQLIARTLGFTCPFGPWTAMGQMGLKPNLR